MAFLAKFSAIFLLFIVTFLFGLLPSLILNYLDQSDGRMKTFLGVMNSFAGGIFFGTAMLHLLPNSVHQLSVYVPSELPIAFVLMGAGFFLMLLIENVITIYHSKFGHSHSQAYINVDEKTSSYKEKCTRISEDDKMSIALNDMNKSSGENSYGTVHESSAEMKPLSSGSHSLDSKQRDDCGSILKVRTVVLLIALSMHMVFEGLAIGLQKTATEVWTLLCVILIHKCIVTFSIGLQLWKFKNFKYILLATVGFSIVAPIGVAIGMIVSEYGQNGRTKGMTSGVLQSLTTGTFLYITFFEILQKELGNDQSLGKIFSAIGGYLAVVLIDVIAFIA